MKTNMVKGGVLLLLYKLLAGPVQTGSYIYNWEEHIILSLAWGLAPPVKLIIRCSFYRCK